MNYNLSFIRNEDLFRHVESTILKYKFRMDLRGFSKNIIDPIKLTFDSSVYGKSMSQLINDEVARQIDKSNTNHIGYFHQNIFKYIGEEWLVPQKGYDIVSEQQNIYVEMKNKHNTMNSSSSQKTYLRMQNTILKDKKAQCLLVEVIAKESQNIVWEISLDGERLSDKRIRRVSIDKFYEIVTGERQAFKILCEILPTVIKDVVNKMEDSLIINTVLDELQISSPNILKSLYLLSFERYEGFKDFNIKQR